MTNQSITSEKVYKHNKELASEMEQLKQDKDGKVSFQARSITDTNNEFYVYAKWYSSETKNTKEKYLGKLGLSDD